MPVREIQVGTVVGHRYRIEKTLGRGPSGTVYMSRDLVNGDRTVAVKVMRSGDCSERQVSLLRHQLSVLSALRHPSLVRILDYGSLGEKNEPFLVEEYFEGENLLESTFGWGSREIVNLLVELCRAVRYLHGRDVVHSNLKPDNVMVASGNGRGAAVKVMDFGLAACLRGGKTVAAPGGGLVYTAPEVILGQPPSVKSDLYSIGVMAYQLLTRRLPFEDEDQEYLVQKQLQGSADLRPIERLESGPGLAQVLRGLLEKDPDRRPASADEVIRLFSVASGCDFSSMIESSKESYFSAPRFVGRDHEMSVLQGRASEILKSGRGGALFVIGDAGLGKTRLLDEFRTWALMDGWRVIDAGCLQGEGESYEVYRHILHRFERVGHGAQGLPVDEIFRFENLPRPADAGLLPPSAESAASRFRDQLTRELVKRLTVVPTVLLLHDFHWADDADTAVLDYLLSDISIHPVLVCVSLRPLKDDQAPLPRLMKQAGRNQRAGLLTLEPLSEESVTEMIVSMTGSKDLGKSVGTWLYTSSGGNPYFVEETLKHLVDRGVLRQESDRWLLEQSKLLRLEAPAGAAVVIRHRVEQLSRAAREVAEWISVIKRPVALDLLARLLSQEAGLVSHALSELMSRQLTRTFLEDGTELYDFRHSLIAEVLYAGISRARRRRMHGNIAEVMESLYGSEGRLQELAIHHTEGKGGEKAVDYALKAASLCRAEFAYEAALRFYEYVLAHPGSLSREAQCQAAIDASDVYCALGIPKRAIRLLERVRSQPARQEPSEQFALLLCKLAYAYQCQGILGHAKRTNKIGLHMLRRLPASSSVDNMRATLLMHIAFADLIGSRPRQGLSLLEPLKPVLVGHGEPEGQLYSLISALHRISCNMRKAVSSAKIALDILKPLDSPRMLAIASSHMGAYLNAQGRYRQAEAYHNLAVTSAERARSVFQQAQAFSNLAECLCRSGRLPESLAISSKIKRLAAITDNRDWMDICAGSIIETCINMGRYADAYESLRNILSPRRDSLPIYARAQALYCFGWLHAALGDSNRATKYLRQMGRLASKQAPVYEMEMAQVTKIISERGQSGREIVRRLLQVHSKLVGKRRPYQLCLTELYLAEESLKVNDCAAARHWALKAIKLARAMPALHMQSLGHLLHGTAVYLQACSRDRSCLTTAEPSGRDEDCLIGQARDELLLAAQLSRNAGTLETSWRTSSLLSELEDRLGNRDNAIKYATDTIRVLNELEKMVPAAFLKSYRASSNRLVARKNCEQLIQRISKCIGAETSRCNTVREEHFATLYHVSSVLNRVRDTDELSARIVESLANALDMDRARLYIADGAGKLRLASEFSKKSAHRHSEHLSTTLVTRAYEEGGVFVTGDIQGDSRLRGLSVGELRDSGTIFVASMKAYGKPIGVLYCDSTIVANQIDSSRINILGAFANIAAVAINNANAHKQLRDEAADLERCLEHAKRGLVEILGDSAAAIELRRRIAIVSRSPLDVLIIGETGTGKELVARALHQCGGRARGAFVAVDCGSLSDTLFESELFGYRKGAFTGAADNRAGLLETANGGIIFLDEISNLSLRLQAKLLRVLQEREVRRIGDGLVRRLDIQVIAATNRELGQEIRKGKFRHDLYYRLKSMEIRVPPLRDRREDIPLLIEWFLRGVSQAHGISKSFSVEAYNRLLDYSYPGNIRELKNNVESSYYLATGSSIEVSDLQPEVHGSFVCQSADRHRARELYDLLCEGRGAFEEIIKQPFLDRLLTGETVKEVLRLALTQAAGKYREAFRLLRIPDANYSVMMLFLKRHRCYLDYRPFRQKR